MRTISLTMRMAANAPWTGEIIVVLVTVEHPSLAAPLRFSSDPTERFSTDPLVYGTVSRGETYIFLPLSVMLPDEGADVEPSMQLVLDNVTREAIPLIRSISSPAQVSVELVLASDPDVVEVMWPQFDLVSASYNASQVTLDLKINALTAEPFPSGRFTPSRFGGLF